MTRNFGNPGSARGSHAHNIDYRAPHAQSPGNDCNLNFNSSAVGFLPYDPWSDLARPARPFIQLMWDLALLGIGALLGSAFASALGLLGVVAHLYLSSS